MTIEDLLDPAATLARVSASNRRQALNAVAEAASRVFGVDAAVALQGLLDREAAGTTGVGHGVALPHARLDGVDRVRAVFVRQVRLEQPVEFEAIDGKPVDLMIALFAPPDATSDHLRALARVSRLMRQPALRQHLRDAESADAVYALLAHDLRTAA
ncbi:MAG: PTS sugar transporter subunit IIA [Caulobacterales bacterium]|nr:PTS sugar transporter subunit IIA [Caulobacterales bacterium]